MKQHQLTKVKRVRLARRSIAPKKGSTDLEYHSELSRGFGGQLAASEPRNLGSAASQPRMADKSSHSAGGGGSCGGSLGSSPSSTLMVPLPEHPEMMMQGCQIVIPRSAEI